MSCDRCGGDGMVMTERGAVQCPCVREKMRLKRLAAAGIPPKYQAYTLDRYDATSPTCRMGKIMADRLVEVWPTERQLGLGLTGPCGIGKTHLVVGILLECHARWSATVRFVELRDLFSQIKDTFGRADRSEQDILRPLLECDVLAIDEIGAARDTDWQRETTEKLINGRYMAGGTLLYTSNQANLPPGARPAKASQLIRTQTAGTSFAAEAQSRFGEAMRQDTLGDRVGMPMWSRLQEMCKHVEMDGEDWRTTRRRA